MPNKKYAIDEDISYTDGVIVQTQSCCDYSCGDDYDDFFFFLTWLIKNVNF